MPLVVIDPELRALEWVKSVLAGLFARVHIFQRCEGGIERVRQYLSRAQMPAVLISSRIRNDPLDRTTGLAELLRRLEEVVSGARAVLAGTSASEVLKRRRIQGFDETVLSAIADSVCHFTGHTHQIVYITRLQLGDQYRFQWAPSTPEEGAPGEA